ncbi:MAG: hypothetical protein Ct9H300mP14_11220 [Gammaproteobacteria bacterium]|nr:MAG: hypothetical protein Ct9H300mP14_11220 [Gammaproteobacteria bacterium]
MREECVIPPAGHWSGTVPQGHRLRIIDLEGGQGVDFLCYNADKHESVPCPQYTQGCTDPQTQCRPYALF